MSVGKIIVRGIWIGMELKLHCSPITKFPLHNSSWAKNMILLHHVEDMKINRERKENEEHEKKKENGNSISFEDRSLYSL